MESLLADRVLRAIALRDVGGVEEKRIRGLIALQVHDAQNLALLDLMKPTLSSGNRQT